MCCKCKKILLSVVVIFAVWSLLDMLINGVWLMPLYKETAALWRPCAEMKRGLMHLITLLTAFPFVMMYTILVSPKTLCRGVRYGVAIGVIVGLGMGFGSYSFMPIPLKLAVDWFIASVVEFGIAGLVLGILMKDQDSASVCCLSKPAESK